MKKQLEQFVVYMKDQLTELDLLPPGMQQRERAQQLWQLYQQRISDFKHERLIHLLVTLFFVAATGVAITASVLLPMLEVLPGVEINQITALGGFAIALILLVVDAFYIKHYFFLENSIQKLYLYEQQLSEYMSSN